MKEKGFTLIELLAVIVILAIIALIATPIILNIINDSRVESKKRSSENYLDAVEQAVVTRNMTEDFRPTSCEIQSDGLTLNCTGYEEPLKIKVDGEVPTSGTITFSDNKVSDINLNYNGYSIAMDENKKLVYNDSEISSGDASEDNFESICTIASDSEVQGLNEGAKYDCFVEEGKPAYTFYVLPSVDSNKVNLIMDRNICEDGNPVTSENNCTYAYNSSGNAQDQGPITALSVLENATKNWKDGLRLNETYEDKGGHFTITLTGKARLPKAEEVASYSVELNNGYLFANLFVNYDGYDVMQNVNGYWGMDTWSESATHALMIIASDGMQWNYDGGPTNVDWSGFMGIRPVISFDI